MNNNSRYEVHKAGKPESNDFMYGVWDTKKEDWARVHSKVPYVSYNYFSALTICDLWNKHHSED